MFKVVSVVTALLVAFALVATVQPGALSHQSSKAKTSGVFGF